MENTGTTKLKIREKCIICGNDITMQKPGSKVCSERVYGKAHSNSCKSMVVKIRRQMFNEALNKFMREHEKEINELLTPFLKNQKRFF